MKHAELKLYYASESSRKETELEALQSRAGCALGEWLDQTVGSGLIGPLLEDAKAWEADTWWDQNTTTEAALAGRPDNGVLTELTLERLKSDLLGLKTNLLSGVGCATEISAQVERIATVIKAGKAARKAHGVASGESALMRKLLSGLTHASDDVAMIANRVARLSTEHQRLKSVIADVTSSSLEHVGVEVLRFDAEIDQVGLLQEKHAIQVALEHKAFLIQASTGEAAKSIQGAVRGRIARRDAREMHIADAQVQAQIKKEVLLSL